MKEDAPPSTTHSLELTEEAEVSRMRNFRPVSPPPGPAPSPSVFHVTTHVDKAGGLAGVEASSPTDGGASQTVFTGTTRTFETMAAAPAGAEPAGQDD